MIHGDSDAIVPFETSGKRSHEAIAKSELVLIKGGPHGLNTSHAEQFNKALLQFVGRERPSIERRRRQRSGPVGERRERQRLKVL